MIIDRGKIILTILLVFIVLVGYYFLSRPLWEKQRSLANEFIVKSQEVERMKNLTRNLRQLQTRRDSLLEINRWQLELMPEERDIPGLIERIVEYGKKTGLDFISFEPHPPVSRGFYEEYFYTLEVLATYHSLGKFISYISNSPRLINIKNLWITREPLQDTPYTLRAKLTLMTYVFKG